jgi:glycosyltransferase involved in cell wall biosynthesis
MSTTGAAPPLTVGMPVYNGEPHIVEAIESILSQSYSDFRFLISDNCSTDNTEEICRSYAARDERISYSRLDKNYGATPNYNRVFEMSRSSLFKFASHDDVCAPGFLEACLSAYEDAPGDLVLCYPAGIEIDADGTPGRPLEDKIDLRQPTAHERLRAFLSGPRLANCYFGVVRASAYASTGLLGAYDSADIVLLSKLALRGQIWWLPEPLFMRRFHEGNYRKGRSTAEITRWFDTSRQGTRYFRRFRLFREFLQGIDRAPLSQAERMRCRKELVAVWLRRNWRSMARELVVGAGIQIPRRTVTSQQRLCE